jgi:hypothetical protein
MDRGWRLHAVSWHGSDVRREQIGEELSCNFDAVLKLYGRKGRRNCLSG